MEFDIVIRGGLLADGSGCGFVPTDLGIQGDTIRAIGDLSAATAPNRIDATGRVVCPGFIDIHTHSDTTLLQYPDAQSRTRQGITTEVVGNCSYSPFPATPLSEAFLGERMCHGGHRSPWHWTDLNGYRTHLEEHKIGVNVAPLVGHAALRIAAMGLEDRAPTPCDISRMRSLAAESIDQGAFGFSTGLTLAPSSFARTPELTAISQAVAARGGFYAPADQMLPALVTRRRRRCPAGTPAQSTGARPRP